jgi:hypothetical protein
MLFEHLRSLGHEAFKVRLSRADAEALLKEIRAIRDNAGVLNDEPGLLGELQLRLERALEG